VRTHEHEAPTVLALQHSPAINTNMGLHDIKIDIWPTANCPNKQPSGSMAFRIIKQASPTAISTALATKEKK
jgi:hypothetical protein